MRTAPDRNPTIDAIFLAFACRMLREAGVDADVVLAEANLDPEILADRDARIPFHLHAGMLEIAALHAGDDCFGLHLGAATNAKNVGVLGYVAMSSATIADAITHVHRYYRIVTSGEVFETHRTDGKLIIEYRVVDLNVKHSRQNDDMALMSALRLLQIASGENLSPDWVECRYTEPSESREYRRLFNTHVRFRSSSNALVFPDTVLDLPIHSADNQLLNILEDYCETVLRERGEESNLLQQVAEIAMRLMPEGAPKASTVARAMGMSTRTFSRRLQEHGKAYRDIVTDIRIGLAERYLQDVNLRLSEVAYLLGYADISTFNHAFNRWVGMSPSRYRRLASNALD